MSLNVAGAGYVIWQSRLLFALMAGGRPRFYPVGTTNADYQRAYRERQRAARAGESRINIMISAEARAQMDELRDSNETDKDLIERLLKVGKSPSFDFNGR